MGLGAQRGLELACACGAIGLSAWAVRGRSSAVFGRSLWRGSADRASIALTFDDGPSEGTPAILKILSQYNVPATFFHCGANVERLPQVVHDVHGAGHEIANHSYAHTLFCFRSPTYMWNDLTRAQEVIESHAGVRPKWFRAPFGVRWFGVGAAQRQLGLTGVMWTVIGYDWKLTSDAIVERVSGRITNGAILCLHDGRELRVKPDIGATVEAVRRLVPMLLDRGYKFETLSRLLCPTT